MTIVVLATGTGICQLLTYEGSSFPDEKGWARSDRPHLADRWLEDGWLVEYAEVVDPGPPELPEDDYYRRSLAHLMGAANLFVEWRMDTDGPREGIPAVAPAVLAVSGRMGIAYHYTIARDLIRYIDSDLAVFYFKIEAGIPHTYRLEIYAGQIYQILIDGQTVFSGFPKGPYPTEDSVIVFGAAAAGGPITARWDYIRYGMIPADASGDYDSDAALSLRDFYFVQECLSNARPGINGGPGNDAGPGCRFADFDSDSDTDLLDLAHFQLNFTGE